MKLLTVWLVRDPSPCSELGDVCWEQVVSRLGDYVFGSGQGIWKAEQTTLYTDRREAEADARARLTKIGGNAK